MKKIDYDVAEYLVDRLLAEKYTLNYAEREFHFKLVEEKKEIEINTIDSSSVNTKVAYQGKISTDGTLVPAFAFARQLFDLAIDGITREALVANLDKELPINGDVVKTKKLKI